jgi:geranylgeranyl diphosphate synthase, type II
LNSIGISFISINRVQRRIHLRSQDFKKLSKQYKKSIEKQLASFIHQNEPETIYKPARYLLSAGGKCFRSALVLLSCEAVGGKAADALSAAAAIELFHNFTLVHDDLMDHADLRRGQPTVHKRWDMNVAILAGDGLAALAYRALLKSRVKRLEEIIQVFTEAFIQVCEGQAFDKEFEDRTNICLDDYLMMIGKKTGYLIAAAAHIGALIGNGTTREIASLRTYGEHLGKAFQIMDDLLDIIGDEREFGKTIGGDIKEGKKTYLMIKALERAKRKDRMLLQLIIAHHKATAAMVNRVRDIYMRYGIIDDAKREIALSTHRAQLALAPLKTNRAKDMLFCMSDQLLERTT